MTTQSAAASNTAGLSGPEAAPDQTPPPTESMPPAFLRKAEPPPAMEPVYPDLAAQAGQEQDASCEEEGASEAGLSDGDSSDAGPAILDLVSALSEATSEHPEDLALALESLLFVAEEPPTVRQLAEATNVSKDAVEEALEVLEADAAKRGIRLQRHGASIRLVSAPESSRWVERFLGLDRPNKLSKAALETLAIIVYSQPVTRSEVERVRGVSCDGPFHTLRARELIEAVGQVDGPGRPNLWAVSQRFLDHFGLRTLAELPPLPELPTPSEQGRLSLAGEQTTQDDEFSGDAVGDPSPETEHAAPLIESQPESSPMEFVAAGGSGD